jgi:hypothetical protein
VPSSLDRKLSAFSFNDEFRVGDEAVFDARVGTSGSVFPRTASLGTRLGAVSPTFAASRSGLGDSS